MINFFDYYHEAVESFQQPSQLGRCLIVDYSSSRIHRVSGFTDFPITCPSLVEPYQTCQQYLEFSELSEGKTVIDLGAYSGLTSIAFSKAVKKSGRVIALEPDPKNFSACQANFKLHSKINGLNNITLLPLAISDKRGKLRFSSEGAMGSSAVDYVGDYRGSILEVECTTLDGIVNEHNLEKVDFIKMDIEGAELDVLRNANEFFKNNRPRLIIEPHVVGGKLNLDDVVRCLNSYNYHCKIIEQWGVSIPLITAAPC